MNDAELLSRITEICTAKNLNTSIFYDHGSVRNIAMLAAGLMIHDGGVSKTSYTQWDGIYAAAKVMELFDNSPGALGATLMIGALLSTDTTMRIEDIMATKALIKSAHVPKIMDEWLEVQIGEVPSAELANILIVYDIINMIRTQEMMNAISITMQHMPMGHQFNSKLFDMESRFEDYEHAHPVLLNVAQSLFPAYKAFFIRDVQKCASC